MTDNSDKIFLFHKVLRMYNNQQTWSLFLHKMLQSNFCDLPISNMHEIHIIFWSVRGLDPEREGAKQLCAKLINSKNELMANKVIDGNKWVNKC